MGSEDKCLSMITMFMEENRRRDEEMRERLLEDSQQREERFLRILQSIQPQTKAAPADEGK